VLTVFSVGTGFSTDLSHTRSFYSSVIQNYLFRNNKLGPAHKTQSADLRADELCANRICIVSLTLYITLVFLFLFQLRTEKEKIEHWKDRLQKEKNEAYRQVRLVMHNALQNGSKSDVTNGKITCRDFMALCTVLTRCP
jgi:hypothetical protein